MQVIYILVQGLFFLAVGAWLGGAGVLSLADRVIAVGLKGRRTEAHELTGRLRGLFQRMELGFVGVAWLATVARGVLVRFVGDFPSRWGPADWAQVAVLAVATVLTAIGTFWLSPAARRRRELVGTYTDKDDQIRVRKAVAGLHQSAEAICWVNIVMLAALMVVSVAALP